MDQRIRELLPTERITRVRSVTWMIVGLHLTQSVHLSCIARRLPFAAKRASTTDRFRRLLNNNAFQVRCWYRPIGEQLLAEAARSRTVRLILDGSKIGAGRQLLIAALAYRKRALPIAWTWVKGPRGHSTTFRQLALLAFIQALMPVDTHVLLGGNCEFGAVAVARQLEKWRWDYVLRRQGHTRVCISRKAFDWRLLSNDGACSPGGPARWFAKRPRMPCLPPLGAGQSSVLLS